jgi:hypothetical protein
VESTQDDNKKAWVSSIYALYTVTALTHYLYVFILTLFPGRGLPLVLPPLLVQLVELFDENAARGVCDGRHVVPMLLHVKQSQIIMCISRRK